MIVTPLSTLNNWYREFRKFAPSLDVIIYHGNPKQREESRDRFERLTRETGKRPILLTTYGVAHNDRAILPRLVHESSDARMSCVVIDEAHALKNFGSIIRTSLQTYYCNEKTQKILITGTPLQNNLLELWSLCNFVMPSIFSRDDVDKFNHIYGLLSFLTENDRL